MQFCSCFLLFCLLSITLLQCSVRGVQLDSDQHVDRSMLRSGALQQRPGALKTGAELTVRLDNLMRMENDIMESKMKRSFPGNNAVLDRLSISSMETRQEKKKQSKVVELPRRRNNPPPIDRIGTSRLPTRRG